MKIHFSPWFSARPYIQRKEGTVRFDWKVSGPAGLLAVLQELAGIHHSPISSQERAIFYYKNMKAKIKEDDLFYKSFQLDPMGVSNRVLQWRDAIVAAGWDIKGADGFKSRKLEFIRQIEPDSFPMGEADMWMEILKCAEKGCFQGAGLSLSIEVPEGILPPVYRKLVEELRRNGIFCEYTEHNLSPNKISIKEFENEEEMFRYAVSDISKWDLIVCDDTKRLDNMFKFVGLPVAGSDLSLSEPQILQLFKLGNSLFQYPCNVTSLLGWLNAPVSPLKGLGWWLARAVVSSGGIYNEEWEKAVNEYNAKDEANDAAKVMETFLPNPECADIPVGDVVAFNVNLAKWAESRMAYAENDDHRAQYALLGGSCKALASVLDGVGGIISHEDIAKYMNGVSMLYKGKHCSAQAGAASVVTYSGDIFERGENVLWLGVYDFQNHKYLYDFLEDSEIKELIGQGVLLYTKEDDAVYVEYQQMLPLKMSGNIVLAVPGKVGGSKVIEHPAVTYLKKKCNVPVEKGYINTGVLEERGVLSAASSMDDEHCISLGNKIKLKRREVESASSLDKLIFHSYDYVMEYCLGIKDKQIADSNNVENVKGTVFHRFIEKLFMDGSKVRDMNDVKRMIRSSDNMEKMFEECVDDCGIILREPQFASAFMEVKERIMGGMGALVRIIEKNELIVKGCEVRYDSVPFVTYEGEDIKLRGSIDMVLEDKAGDVVVFDFKYSAGTYYEGLLKENKSVQLAVYRHFMKGKNVRAAYIFLKGMRGVSTDTFTNYISQVKPRESVDMMQFVKDRYIGRWNELDTGKIDCSGEDYKYSKYKDLIK